MVIHHQPDKKSKLPRVGVHAEIVGIWYKEVIVGLIPICIHFIISNIILSNIQDRINDDHENLIFGKDKMNYWKYINIATIILSFISSVVFLII